MDDCHMFKIQSEDGTALFARHWPATGARATLLLIHGFGEHSGRYGAMATHLSDNGVQVLAIDLRGHGQSDGPRGVIRHYDDFRADLRAGLNHARQLHSNAFEGRTPGPLVLYGHSMGGGIVLDHGLNHPHDFNGIIASAPLIRPADPVPGALKGLAKMVSSVRPNSTMKNAIKGDQISTLPDEQTAYEIDPLNHDRLGFKLALEIMTTGESIYARAAQWQGPLLLIHAVGDQLTQFAASEHFAQTAPGTDFRPLLNVEHEIHNDTSRAAVYRAMLDFIGSL